MIFRIDTPSRAAFCYVDAPSREDAVDAAREWPGSSVVAAPDWVGHVIVVGRNQQANRDDVGLVDTLVARAHAFSSDEIESREAVLTRLSVLRARIHELENMIETNADRASVMVLRAGLRARAAERALEALKTKMGSTKS